MSKCVLVRFGILIPASLCLHIASPAAREPSLLTPSPLSDSSDYTVYQSLPIDFPGAGLTGYLQVLEDSRVTQDYRRSWGVSADSGAALGANSPLLRSIKNAPLENGRIRLVDRKGNTISVLSAGEPLATITMTHLWRIVPTSNGVGKEIEVVQCHPNFNNPHWAANSEFIVIYSTYRFTGASWVPKSSEKAGFWESDNGWPPRSTFP